MPLPAEIDTWIWDLDDTLYPPGTGLADQMKDRIREYLRALFRTDDAGARLIQSELVAPHGTTLRGLMNTMSVDPEDYLRFEHTMDYSVLAPDPRLPAAIAGLSGRKFVFTNGSAWHAEQALTRLGLAQHFDGVFDILAGELIPKPYPESYQRFVEQFAIEPRRAAMFDDLAHNLTVPRQLGMATILVAGPALPNAQPDRGGGVGQRWYEVIGPAQLRTWDLPAFLHSLGVEFTP